jgi:protein involved in polysaccharide export with SLBB domain
MNFSFYKIFFQACFPKPRAGFFSGRKFSARFTKAILFIIFATVAICPARATDSATTNHPTDAASAVVTTNALSNLPTNNVDQLDDKYRLVVGDQLSFRIVEDEDDPVVLPVTDSGDIQVPYLGRYPAVNKTCKELALALKAELEKKYYYQATVIVAVNSMPRSRGKIYLVGAIHAPGPQDISSDEALTLSKAILRGGGFTDFADEKKVTVTRTTGSGIADKKTFIVDVSQILEKGDTQDDLALLPGDLIYVPERLIRF